MTLWSYNTALPPPLAYEAVEDFVSRVKTADLLSGALYLGSNDNVLAGEEPVDKPTRWVLVSEFTPLGGPPDEPSGLVTVRVMVRVVSEKNMLSHGSPSQQTQSLAARQWHDAVHARIARSVVGLPDVYAAGAVLNSSEIGWPWRRVGRPSTPQYDNATDTRYSYAYYDVTLEPKQV